MAKKVSDLLWSGRFDLILIRFTWYDELKHPRRAINHKLTIPSPSQRHSMVSRPLNERHGQYRIVSNHIDPLSERTYPHKHYRYHL